ncbi:MAG: helix-turn-helix transcriptional regulator [Legionellaceae bacterium]|nr:helix-turn-helix transcriptional regulator [Legionellaceae bacterium]
MILGVNLSQYSASATHIAEIAKPLGSMGIVGLCYMRLYYDGSILNLASCPNWTDFYFEQLYQNTYSSEDLSDHLFIDKGVSLWALNPHNQVWRDVGDKFGYGHGVSLCEEHEDFREIMAFYSTKNNHAMNHFYINQTDQLKKLKQYFLSEASELIQKSEHQRVINSPLILFENMSLSDVNKPKQSIITPVDLETSWSYVFHKDTHEPIHLPVQQNLCFKYLMEGKSAKEIARAMGLSPRTVEYYLSIIRQQLGCRSSRELILSYAEQLN